MKGGNAGSRRGSCSFLCTVQEVAIPLPVLLKLSELTFHGALLVNKNANPQQR